MDKTTKHKIYADYLSGTTTTELGPKYGYSYGTVIDLIHRMDWLNNRLSDESKELYHAITDLPGSNDSRNLMLFHALCRHDIFTLEKLKTMTPKQLVKVKGVGRSSVKRLCKAGLIGE